MDERESLDADEATAPTDSAVVVPSEEGQVPISSVVETVTTNSQPVHNPPHPLPHYFGSWTGFCPGS